MEFSKIHSKKQKYLTIKVNLEELEQIVDNLKSTIPQLNQLSSEDKLYSEESLEQKSLNLEDNTMDITNIYNDEKINELVHKIKEYKNKIEEIKEQMVQKLEEETSKTKKCKSCGSVIAKEFIKNTQCPVCNEDFLTTETRKKQLDKLEEKILKSNQELEKRVMSSKKIEYKVIELYNINILKSIALISQLKTIS